MFARAAVLTLLMSGSALAAPPSVSRPDLARIFATVKAGHPDHTPKDKLAPVSTLAEVAKEAGQAIEYAPTQDLHRLMNYIRVARLTAYDRTGDAAHACALVEDSDLLLARKDAPVEAVKEANMARGEATRLCVPPPAATQVPLTTTSPANEVAQQGLTRAVGVNGVDEAPKRERRHVASGMVLGAAGFFTVFTGIFAGYAVSMKQGVRNHVQELEARGYRTAFDDTLLDLGREGFKLDRGIAIGAGILSAGMWGLGAWLFTMERKAGKPKRVSVMPFGGSRVTGLMLSGRF